MEEIRCDLCGERVAVVHIDRIYRGIFRLEFHYCEECALKAGIVIPDRLPAGSGPSRRVRINNGPSNSIRGHAVDESEFLEAIGLETGIETVDLEEEKLDSRTPQILSEETALRMMCVPFAVDSIRKTVSVAISDPFDGRAIENLRARIESRGYLMRTFLARRSQIANRIRETYGDTPVLRGAGRARDFK